MGFRILENGLISLWKEKFWHLLIIPCITIILLLRTLFPPFCLIDFESAVIGYAITIYSCLIVISIIIWKPYNHFLISALEIDGQKMHFPLGFNGFMTKEFAWEVVVIINFCLVRIISFFTLYFSKWRNIKKSVWEFYEDHSI